MSKQLRATVHRRHPLPIEEFVKLLLEQARAKQSAARRADQPDEERGAA